MCPPRGPRSRLSAVHTLQLRRHISHGHLEYTIHLRFVRGYRQLDLPRRVYHRQRLRQRGTDHADQQRRERRQASAERVAGRHGWCFPPPRRLDFLGDEPTVDSNYELAVATAPAGAAFGAVSFLDNRGALGYGGRPRPRRRHARGADLPAAGQERPRGDWKRETPRTCREKNA